MKETLIAAVKLQTHTGSSTVVLAKFDDNDPNLLKTTNLGDSGYLLCHVEGTEEKPILKQYFRSKE